MSKHIKISVYLSVIISVLTLIYDLWARILPPLGNLLLQIVILILGLSLLLFLGIAIIKLFFNNNFKQIQMYVPIFLIPLVFTAIIYNPLNIDYFFGKVIYQACYEGTQNQAILKLRANGEFDIHWTGVFGYDEYFLGKFEEKNDTLFFNFKNGTAPRNLENLAIKSKGKGILFFEKNDSELEPSLLFYEGKCRGLN